MSLQSEAITIHFPAVHISNQFYGGSPPRSLDRNLTSLHYTGLASLALEAVFPNSIYFLLCKYRLPIRTECWIQTHLKLRLRLGNKCDEDILIPTNF